MLERMPGIKTVFLCLDNDEAGHAASARMAALLKEQGVHSERLIPKGKDWNDDLLALRKQEQVQGMGQGQPQELRQGQKIGNEVQTNCQTFGC